MYCPLCNAKTARPSWLGATVYQQKKYDYVECVECGSLYSSPMPDAKTLEQMYGADYQQFLSVEAVHGGDAGVQEILDWLSEREKGIFFDYGCGAGKLLGEVAKLGWECVGLELDRATAEKYSQIHNLKIVSDLADLPPDFRADVIHLGDVIEHLTDVNNQFLVITNLLKKDGIIIAQGPLEANTNLFLLGLKLSKLVRPQSISSMPPYHVSLATVQGQKNFFDRFGLEKIVFNVFETAHPAPDKLGFAQLKSARLTTLFFIRKLSQTVSALSHSEMGNRYFYIGRRIA